MNDTNEKTLHKALVKYLNILQKTRAFEFFHVKNDVGIRKGGFFFDLKPLGVKSGVPDFVFLLPSGSVKFLEIKRLKGYLSKNQKAFIQKLQELNHEVHVGKGWDGIMEKVKEILGLK